MKASEIVESIKEVLGMQLAEIKVELEIRELDNGTKIEAEKFEEGEPVFIITESGDEVSKIAVPVGNYEMNDGTVLVVSEEGVIGELREASDEVPQEEDLEEKEELADEGNYVTIDDWRGMEKRIQNLEDAISDLKGDKQSVNSKEDEMYSKENKVEEVKVKASDNSLDLSSVEVKAEPIAHSPEKVQAKERVQLGKKRSKSTLSRVLDIINNN